MKFQVWKFLIQILQSSRFSSVKIQSKGDCLNYNCMRLQWRRSFIPLFYLNYSDNFIKLICIVYSSHRNRFLLDASSKLPWVKITCKDLQQCLLRLEIQTISYRLSICIFNTFQIDALRFCRSGYWRVWVAIWMVLFQFSIILRMFFFHIWPQVKYSWVSGRNTICKRCKPFLL